MDLENARGYKNEMQDVKTRIASHESSAEVSELSPKKRFKALGERLKSLPNSGDNSMPAYRKNVKHVFEEADGSWVSVQARALYNVSDLGLPKRTMHSLHSLRIYWGSSAGDLGIESLNEGSTDWHDPEVMRTIGLMEDSVAELEEAFSAPPASPAE